MSYIGIAAFEETLSNLWNTEGLDTLFQSYWEAGAENEWTTLNNEEAGPAQAWPYCVYSIPSVVPTLRMSGGAQATREIHEFPLEFHVYSHAIGEKGAKEMAAELAQEILKVFGGHPTVPPSTNVTNVLDLRTNGNFGVRVDDTEWQWIVRYIGRLDLRVATG